MGADLFSIGLDGGGQGEAAVVANLENDRPAGDRMAFRVQGAVNRGIEIVFGMGMFMRAKIRGSGRGVLGRGGLHGDFLCFFLRDGGQGEEQEKGNERQEKPFHDYLITSYFTSGVILSFAKDLIRFFISFRMTPGVGITYCVMYFPCRKYPIILFIHIYNVKSD